MTEADWATSEDSRAMLDLLLNRRAHFQSGLIPARPSDRKLRLFACACCRLIGARPVDVDQYEDHGPHALREPHPSARITDLEWAQNWARLRTATEMEPLPDPDLRPIILRDLVNPWLRHPLPAECRTPTVLALAKVAHQERGVGVCGSCKGRKYLGGPAPGQPGWIGAPDCSDCHGTGRIDTGTLDPARLLILADALEEAGLDSSEQCVCDGGWLTSSQGERIKRYRCDVCGGAGRVGKANPLLAHLRSPGPHFRGCWALDHVLGKE